MNRLFVKRLSLTTQKRPPMMDASIMSNPRKRLKQCGMKNVAAITTSPCIVTTSYSTLTQLVLSLGYQEMYMTCDERECDEYVCYNLAFFE